MNYDAAMTRTPRTKWDRFDLGLKSSAPVRRNRAASLRHFHFKTLVLEEVENMKRPNQGAVSSGVTLLDDYIHQTYQPAATFGAYTILRLGTS